MFPITEAEFLATDVKRFRVQAPRVARRFRPGQFIILRVHDHGERIPLTVAEVDKEKGEITIIVQGIGKTTKLLNRLSAGDAILDVAGPLGRPSHVEKFGTVVVIGGGVGAAIAYPTAAAFQKEGNEVISILGARTKDLLILEKEIEAISTEFCITTDDGSYGTKGFVTDKLKALIDEGRQLDLVLAIGPIPMMRAVAETTRGTGIKTVVSLNAVMVDGTGMCGGCRVIIDGKSEFACVDGPEFDAHKVDFKVMAQRSSMYREAEKASLDRFLAEPDRDLELVRHHCKLEAKHPEITMEKASS